jgi:hypothetical protein
MEGLLKVSIPDLQKILANFRGTPKEITKLLGLSIKDALAAGRTALIGRGGASEGIRSRYNVKYRTMLQAIGRPRVFGITGSLNISGPKIPLFEFPTTDSGESGVYVSEIKGQTPINLRHAFQVTRKGPVYQRETPHGPRIPIRWVMGLSVPEMAKSSKVMPATEARIKEQLAKRLWHYISQFNAGTLPSRVLRGR